MERGKSRHRLMAIAACLLLAACTQTSRVDDDLSTASLTQTKKAVAVMRVGAASPSCINVAVLLGVREGDGYRRHQGITVANVRSITEPAVAEVELDPGEYHVLAYRCQSATGSVKTVDDNAGGQLYRTSYASFTLQAGEIVNVGYLHLHAWRHGNNTFGRPVEMDIEITDWPLAGPLQGEASPHLRADDDAPHEVPRQPGEPGPRNAPRLKALLAEGKVQQLPPACAPAATARRKTGAVANSAASL